MRFVEEEHAFPSDPAEVHEKRLRRLLEMSALALPPIVIVGGSCGKASTARMLAFILRALGVPRVGLGTKPPLRETHDGNRERYQVLDADGARWIAREEFARIVDELLPIAARCGEKFAPYDLRMWILLKMFVELQVSIGIVEANIGLRHDPTAAIPSPALTVLTRVATDHAALLRPPQPIPQFLQKLGDAAGPTWHKAGGLRNPSVVGRQDPDVLRAILEIAPPPTSLYGRDFDVESSRCTLGGSEARFRLGERHVDVALSALGPFQVENAATAAAAAALLHDAHSGIEWARISAAINRGLREADTPGRMQIVGRDPLVIFNLAAGEAKLRAMMESVVALTGPRDLVVGLSVISRSGDPRACVGEIVRHPQVKTFLATSFLDDGDTRDLPAEQLAAWARELRPDLEVDVVPPAEARENARRRCRPGGAVLLAGDGLGASLELHAEPA